MSLIPVCTPRDANLPSEGGNSARSRPRRRRRASGRANAPARTRWRGAGSRRSPTRPGRGSALSSAVRTAPFAPHTARRRAFLRFGARRRRACRWRICRACGAATRATRRRSCSASCARTGGTSSVWGCGSCPRRRGRASCARRTRRGKRGEGRDERNATGEGDAWEGDYTFLLRRAWQKRLLLISRPTEVGTRAGRPARAALHQLVTRATIAISSELYLRHVTRASPLFVRASGH